MFGKKKDVRSKNKKKRNITSDEDLINSQIDEENKSELSLDDNNFFESEKRLVGKDVLIDKDEDINQEKKEHLNSVKQKISKILMSSNIEIVDENDGDDYNSESSTKEKLEQDYESLKSMFSGKDDKKRKELVLTVDDFDYTYTGQYLDEFDILNITNIKRIHLQSKYGKLIKKISLISSLVLIVIGSIVAAILLTREKPVYLKSISLNHSDAYYFVDDQFDYSGLYIIAEYSNGQVDRLKLKPEHFKDMTGNLIKEGSGITFTGTAPARLIFTYGGLDVNYDITVENKVVSGLDVVYSAGLFDLNEGEIINKDNLKILVKHSNFNSKYLDYNGNNIEIYVDNIICSYDENGFKTAVSTEGKSILIKYLNNGKEFLLEFDSNGIKEI